MYNALKQRYGFWAKRWPECTDPQKAISPVFELRNSPIPDAFMPGRV
jgi:hypothetical protein